MRCPIKLDPVQPLELHSLTAVIPWKVDLERRRLNHVRSQLSAQSVELERAKYVARTDFKRRCPHLLQLESQLHERRGGAIRRFQ